MSERFVNGVYAKIALYKYSSFPFISFRRVLPEVILTLLQETGNYTVSGKSNPLNNVR